MSTPTTTDALDYQAAVEDEPLTAEELKLMHRLLSDPTVLPRKFKQWVTDHSSDTVDISKSQVHGLISNNGAIIITAQSWEQLGAAFCPMILPYPAQTPPPNWLRCNGQMLPQSDYPVLFNYLGHAHDIITSTGQFGLPDLRGRCIYGYDENGGAGGLGFGFGTRDSASTGGRGAYHKHITPVDVQINVGTQLAAGSNYPRFAPQTLDYPSKGVGGVTYPIQDSGGFYALNYIIASGRTP